MRVEVVLLLMRHGEEGTEEFEKEIAMLLVFSPGSYLGTWAMGAHGCRQIVFHCLGFFLGVVGGLVQG